MPEKVNPCFQRSAASIAQQPVDLERLVGPFCSKKQVVSVRENEGLLDPFASVELRPKQAVHIWLGEASLELFDAGAGNHRTSSQSTLPV